jgi:protein-tyrosine phosphatase
MNKNVLFLCTGNYYRSRFAEILFNHLAAERKLDWRADSRGLAIEMNRKNAGAISHFTIEKLQTLGIEISAPRLPQKVSVEDLERADLTVAMYDAEHRPMVFERLPAWIDRVEFWQVPDVDFVPPSVALPEIERQVESLIARLSGSSAVSA